MTRTPRGRPSRLALAALGLGAWYVVALLLVPSQFMTTDAAKYVGLGRNMLAGAGPVTGFGVFFPYHSPTWPVVVMAPEVLAGVEWTLWARMLNIAGAAVVLGLTGLLAWMASPRAGVLAVALFAVYVYAFELARTLGLDQATAASTLAFAVLALGAGSRRPTSWGIVVGVAFGIAFLVKEVPLTLAPLPVLAVLLAGAGWRVALRLLGTYAAVAFAVTGWWFLLFASHTGTVYRLGTPAWTLVPLALGIAALFVVGRLAGREQPDGPADPRRLGRERALAWATAIGWAILLMVFFQLSQQGTDVSLLRPRQLAWYARTWGFEVLPVTILAATGAGIAAWERARGRLGEAPSRHVDGLVHALVLGAPLVLLVVAVGETPRHYVAQVAILVALGAVGWASLLDRLAGRVRATRGPAARVARWIVPVSLVGAVVASGLLVGWAVRRDLQPERMEADDARSAALTAVGDWVAANLRPGETVVMGSVLNYPLSTVVPQGTRTRILREDQNVHARPDAALGVGRAGRPPQGDWVVLMADPHDDTSFYGYQRSAIVDGLRAIEGDIWIEGSVVDRGSRAPILAALDDATGLDPVESWSFPYRDREIQVTAYRVDAEALGWAGDAVYLDGATLGRLVEALEASPGAAAEAARNLGRRARLVDGPHDDLMARLRALGGG